MNKVYIELGEAINIVRNLKGNCDHRFYDEGLMDACSELIGLKPADVVEARRTSWKYNEHGQMFCSWCGLYPELAIEKPYCPHCGAKMDGGKK